MSEAVLCGTTLKRAWVRAEAGAGGLLEAGACPRRARGVEGLETGVQGWKRRGTSVEQTSALGSGASKCAERSGSWSLLARYNLRPRRAVSTI